MSVKSIYNITIGELIQIRKISKMTFKDGIPAALELQDKHGLTENEVKNLICLARDFRIKVPLSW